MPAGAEGRHGGAANAGNHLAMMSVAGVVVMSALLVNPVAPVLFPSLAVLSLLVAAGSFPLRTAAALSWRLKWFLLSLLLFFGWWYPGVAVVGWERALPSFQGLFEAVVRIAALLVVVCWVAWLTHAFDRERQVVGLSRWLALLRPLGLRGDVFARRLFLALHYFQLQHHAYRAFRQPIDGSRWRRLRAARELLIGGLDRALAGAEPQGSGAQTPAASAPAAAPDWQVFLLWVAVVATLWVRVAQPFGLS